jgi:hypothetical protein
VALAFTAPGGIATAGAMIGGSVGSLIGFVVGVFLIVSLHALRRRERS